MTSDLKKCFVEFMGTFFFAFAVLSCLLLSVNQAVAPLAIGFILIALTYASEPVSGGHFNPAVSLAVYFIGRMGSKKAFLYCIFQIFGAAYASLMVLFMASSINMRPLEEMPLSSMIVAEITFMIAFIYVFLFTLISKKVTGNNYHGLAIGSTFTAGAYCVGGVCLAVFNPAVAIALGLVGLTSFKFVLITIGVDLVAIFIACGLFKLLNVDDVEKVEIVKIDEFMRK